MRSKRSPVPLKRLSGLSATIQHESFPQHRTDVVPAVVFHVARAVQELLSGDGVAAREFEMRAAKNRHLFGLLPVRRLLDQRRLAEQTLGFVKVVVSTDLVSLGAAQVDVVRSERAQDARAFVLGVGVELLNLCRTQNTVRVEVPERDETSEGGREGGSWETSEDGWGENDVRSEQSGQTAARA